jgi:hypothetical protein
MGRHRFHGDPERFEVLAAFIAECDWPDVRHIADVAGGQGMLARVLSRRWGYAAEVIDPRGHTLRGIAGRAEPFAPAMAAYYDLIVGLHPDEATRAVAEAACVRRAILIPCCNFWSEAKLGQEALLQAIEAFYRERRVAWTRVVLPFKGPKNIALVSTPPG